MHHFRLVTADGEPLGTIELARPDWPPGYYRQACAEREFGGAG